MRTRDVVLTSVVLVVSTAGCHLADPIESPVELDTSEAVDGGANGGRADVAGDNGDGETCAPATDAEACERRGAECGEVPNSCGETADCGTCASDEMCTSDNVCIECRSDADCDASACETCEEGVCEATCTGECEACDGSGNCVDDDSLCDADECETCTTGFCTSECTGCLTCEAGSCRNDDTNCPDGKICCREAGVCTAVDSQVECPE